MRHVRALGCGQFVREHHRLVEVVAALPVLILLVSPETAKETIVPSTLDGNQMDSARHLRVPGIFHVRTVEERPTCLARARNQIRVVPDGRSAIKRSGGLANVGIVESIIVARLVFPRIRKKVTISIHHREHAEDVADGRDLIEYAIPLNEQILAGLVTIAVYGGFAFTFHVDSIHAEHPRLAVICGAPVRHAVAKDRVGDVRLALIAPARDV